MDAFISWWKHPRPNGIDTANHREIPGSTPGRYNLQIEITSTYKYTTSMQHWIQHLCFQGPLREYRSIRSGASGLPYSDYPSIALHFQSFQIIDSGTTHSALRQQFFHHFSNRFVFRSSLVRVLVTDGSDMTYFQPFIRLVKTKAKRVLNPAVILIRNVLKWLKKQCCTELLRFQQRVCVPSTHVYVCYEARRNEIRVVD